MKLIRDILAGKKAAGKPAVSFEFFPPKTAEGDRALLEKQIPALLAARPDFCSVTYGAGGSTREKTLRIVDNIQRQHPCRRWRISPASTTPATRSARCWRKSARSTAGIFSPCAATRPAAASSSPRPAASSFPRSW